MKQRYEEHKHSFESNCNSLKFEQRFLVNRRPFGRINDAVVVRNFSKSGAYMDTVERFDIYKKTEREINLTINTQFFRIKLYLRSFD